MAATLAAILNEAPPDVSAFVADVPSEIDRLFRAALARDPAVRPASAAEWAESVAQRLDAMSSGEDGWPLPITHELSLRGNPAPPPVR